MDGTIPLREARRRLGVSDSTARRWIRKGKLAAKTRDGLYGTELWVPVADVDAVVKQRRAQGLLPAAAPPSPETIPLGRLITWAQHPLVTREFLRWSHTASTVTPLSVLRWVRAQLGGEQG